MTEKHEDKIIADASKQNWVDAYAPEMVQPYLKLSRVDRPIGTWLLLFPCWWSVALATGQGQLPDAFLLVCFAIGAFVMRGAGCTLNDIADRNFDGMVERTRKRPIPSGQVSVRQAVIWLAVQCLVGLLVLLQFNLPAIIVGAASLVLVAIYPFAKRFTYWPQFFLGLAFNYGALLGWVGQTGSLSWTAVILYVGGISWTLGYDTIYAHQDKEDDILIGVKSTALKFGNQTTDWLFGFYLITLLSLTLCGWLNDLSVLFYIGIAGAGAHLLWQIRYLDIDNSDRCLMLFKSNKIFGAIVLFAIVAGNFQILD
ncbi:4-hydroxybenzoate octaprenyltransferase [Sneathiella aquimaris]|uniref:4-hydroxybenzoate octaprenyltransferase n=1 Tax=Sneathiella aquimaris TaxID=2599305 RepID=UPI00146F7BD0|nr:4-hydroxybenzoate octaprenyltransferase [Sneathiella aquimaris]